MKLHGNKIAPFAFVQHELLTLNFNFGDRFQRIDRNRKWLDCRGRAFAERVVRTNQVRSYLPVLDLDRYNFTAFDRSCCDHDIICVVRKCAVAAAQIRGAKARKRIAVRLDRREIRGDPEHCIWNAVVVKKLPESLAMPQLLGATPAERDKPVADLDSVPWRFDPGSRKV